MLQLFLPIARCSIILQSAQHTRIKSALHSTMGCGCEFVSVCVCVQVPLQTVRLSALCSLLRQQRILKDKSLRSTLSYPRGSGKTRYRQSSAPLLLLSPPFPSAAVKQRDLWWAQVSRGRGGSAYVLLSYTAALDMKCNAIATYTEPAYDRNGEHFLTSHRTSHKASTMLQPVRTASSTAKSMVPI